LKHGRHCLREDEDDRALTLFPPHFSHVPDQRLSTCLLSVSPQHQKEATGMQSQQAQIRLSLNLNLSSTNLSNQRGKNKESLSPFSPIASSGGCFTF
jgi:hypothetical protein